VEVWLLSLNYKPVTAVLNFTPRPLCFSSRHKPVYGGVEVWFLSLNYKPVTAVLNFTPRSVSVPDTNRCMGEWRCGSSL